MDNQNKDNQMPQIEELNDDMLEEAAGGKMQLKDVYESKNKNGYVTHGKYDILFHHD